MHKIVLILALMAGSLVTSLVIDDRELSSRILRSCGPLSLVPYSGGFIDESNCATEILEMSTSSVNQTLNIYMMSSSCYECTAFKGRWFGNENRKEFGLCVVGNNASVISSNNVTAISRVSLCNPAQSLVSGLSTTKRLLKLDAIRSYCTACLKTGRKMVMGPSLETGAACVPSNMVIPTNSCSILVGFNNIPYCYGVNGGVVSNGAGGLVQASNVLQTGSTYYLVKMFSEEDDVFISNCGSPIAVTTGVTTAVHQTTGSLTTSVITSGSHVTTNQLTTSPLTSGVDVTTSWLTTSPITSGVHVTTNTLTTNSLTTSVVTSSALTTNEVTSGAITSNGLTSGAISSGSFTSSVISSGGLTTSYVTTGDAGNSTQGNQTGGGIVSQCTDGYFNESDGCIYLSGNSVRVNDGECVMNIVERIGNIDDKVSKYDWVVLVVFSTSIANLAITVLVCVVVSRRIVLKGVKRTRKHGKERSDEGSDIGMESFPIGRNVYA